MDNHKVNMDNQHMVNKIHTVNNQHTVNNKCNQVAIHNNQEAMVNHLCNQEAIHNNQHMDNKCHHLVVCVLDIETSASCLEFLKFFKNT